MEPINAKRLKKLGACIEQVELFQSIFGEADAPLTLETVKAYASVFEFSWAARRLLSPEKYKTYEEAEAPLLKAYAEAKVNLWKAYREAKAPLLKAYREAEAPLWKAYREAKAELFFNLYMEE